MAASEIKAVELDFFSTSNCFSSCFLHAPVGDPFYERYNPFNNMDPLSETDVIQTESPENRPVSYSRPHWGEWRKTHQSEANAGKKRVDKSCCNGESLLFCF